MPAQKSEPLTASERVKNQNIYKYISIDTRIENAHTDS